MKRNQKIAILGFSLMTMSSTSLTCIPRFFNENYEGNESPMLCVLDSYVNAERYELWTEEEKLAWNTMNVCTSILITSMCPPLGIAHSF